MSKEDSVKGVARSEKGEAAKAYDDLRKWGFLKIKRTGYGDRSLSSQICSGMFKLF